MNFFDHNIISFLNGFAGKSWAFDHLIFFVTTHASIKVILVATLLYWAWFANEDSIEKRESLIAAVVLTGVAIAIAILLPLVLPFRVRPLHNPELSLSLPYGVSTHTLLGWNSFPSDHAVMFFALSTGLWFVSKRISIVALFYSLLVICLPRIYLGFHHPTDILAGAFIGALIASLGAVPSIRSFLAYLPVQVLRRSPAAFYSCFFVGAVQITNMFGDIREVVFFTRDISQGPISTSECSPEDKNTLVALDCAQDRHQSDKQARISTNSRQIRSSVSEQ